MSYTNTSQCSKFHLERIVGMTVFVALKCQYFDSSLLAINSANTNHQPKSQHTDQSSNSISEKVLAYQIRIYFRLFCIFTVKQKDWQRVENLIKKKPTFFSLKLCARFFFLIFILFEGITYYLLSIQCCVCGFIVVWMQNMYTVYIFTLSIHKHTSYTFFLL